MKNKIEITEDAQNYIDDLIKKDESDYFRITVLGGGCAGFQYKFDFDKKKNDDDILIKTNKISVLIDKISLGLINGSKIDYVDELIGSSFKVTNPKASSSCGCGTSFSL
ncbi:MAG: iron-sulfur cluster insertion protein ErpA [Pelagibacteraceae bacterium]|jgi:iron-sulfur cluster assembly accessory protein|nr:iron-sulfur cluster insertion protein ErpA [Pelagibacteraceae bacterium]MDP6784190.1 iron-sulfur cluster insertion protein ErpA [Alphaproteobacteria bacterium]MBO6466735.1 iron-sulfur cluster insertion protein ErpA [Pelagibacteraceae bacterium]MBO6467728.1 iron-sulfur cluster insertion protein ErpA [Pelagibacteraceae bacterium]MBO6469458.1 iron-sulfur cluster insertion protein ErpA [Pelagibacteraceae bacterium]|tara:strand:- start:12 stop:338 length:327 start_codon:yes stop_codon:yes gene_type:complete